MTTDNTPPVLACNLKAIPPDQREQHGVLASQLFSAALETVELSDGYAFRLPTQSDVLINAATFIANERLCCPFIHFNLEITPNSGVIWLRLTGGQGVKELLKAELLP